MNVGLLQKLISIPGATSDEGKVKEYILEYVRDNCKNWKVVPQIVEGNGFQDCLILILGQPKTAIYAHMDSIGFTVGYDKELIRIGSPRTIDGTVLVGEDSLGPVIAELLVLDREDGNRSLRYISDGEIDRGTILTFQPNFRETEEAIQSPYMDNRLGVFCALEVAKTMRNGAIVFSTYEEHGGNTVGFCAQYLLNKYGVTQTLICDITWVTHGIKHGGGVAISMRDSGIPRRSYLNRIIQLAKISGVAFQLEVESAGGSDGTQLQKSDLPIDWCFIGAPEDHVHSPDELVFKKDIHSMIELYKYLMDHL